MKKIVLLLILVMVGLGAPAQVIDTSEAILTDDDKYEEIIDPIQISPEFPGGEDSLRSFLRNNIKYPGLALESDVEGRVFVCFVVEKDGSIDPKTIQIKREIGGGCGEEAVRVVMLMPKWKPGMQQGEVARATFCMPVEFKLPTWEEHKSMFEAALGDGDTIRQRQVLVSWKRKFGSCPEMVVAEYNYYYHRARNSSIAIQSDRSQFSGNDYMTFTDELGNEMYMGEVVTFDSALVNKALDVINDGIFCYPNRLDMIFGKLHLLGETHRWDAYADELERVVSVSKEYEKRWVFPGAEGDIAMVFTESIHDYEASLVYAVADHVGHFAAEDSLCVLALRRVAKSMNKIYPKDVVNLNFWAVSYSAMGMYAEALEPLRKAARLDKKDMVVLSNMADLYHNLGNYKREQKCLEKMIKHCTRLAKMSHFTARAEMSRKDDKAWQRGCERVCQISVTLTESTGIVIMNICL